MSSCSQPNALCPTLRRSLAAVLVLMAAASAVGACAAQKQAPAADELQALMHAGLPLDTPALLAAVGTVACADGGSRTTRITTLMAGGERQQARATVVFSGCRLAQTRMDGTLFVEVTRHLATATELRISTDVNGKVAFAHGAQAAATSCAVELSATSREGRWAQLPQGAICGVPVRLSSAPAGHA